MTLNDLERRNSPSFAFSHRIRLLCWPITSDAEDRTIISSFCWTKHRNVTDRQTDGRTDGRTDGQTAGGYYSGRAVKTAVTMNRMTNATKTDDELTLDAVKV